MLLTIVLFISTIAIQQSLCDGYQRMISCFHGFSSQIDQDRVVVGGALEICNTTGSCYTLTPGQQSPIIGWYELGCSSKPCRQGVLVNPRSGASKWIKQCCQDSFCNNANNNLKNTEFLILLLSSLTTTATTTMTMTKMLF